ncbi:MAG TPA: hypothetical protein QF753_03300 [Victivallales bacterium]|nr:hypothetical protein [Victivallales bacterium]
MENFSNEFSWSISRNNLFNYCEKAYYFHYYGAWNGWAKHSDDLAIQLFKLKHLKTKELWLSNIICCSFKMAITKQIPPNLINVKKYSIRLILKDISSLQIKSWSNDPKQINLFSTYYKLVDAGSIKIWALEKIDNYFSHLHVNKALNSLIKVPLIMQKHYDRNFKFFKLNNLKIWLNPLSIYTDRNKLIAVNCNFDISSNNNWSFSSTLSTLYIMLYWKPEINNILTQTLFIKQNVNYTVYSRRALKEILKIINSSAIKMRSRLSFTDKAYFNNFIKTTDQKKCHTCNFKEACMTK